MSLVHKKCGTKMVQINDTGQVYRCDTCMEYVVLGRKTEKLIEANEAIRRALDDLPTAQAYLLLQAIYDELWPRNDPWLVKWNEETVIKIANIINRALGKIQ